MWCHFPASSPSSCPIHPSCHGLLSFVYGVVCLSALLVGTILPFFLSIGAFRRSGSSENVQKKEMKEVRKEGPVVVVNLLLNFLLFASPFSLLPLSLLRTSPHQQFLVPCVLHFIFSRTDGLYLFGKDLLGRFSDEAF